MLSHRRQGHTARFSVADNEKAAALIAALFENGLRVFQSNFEKRELVELFLTDLRKVGANESAAN